METNKPAHTPEPWTESAKEIDGEPTDVNYRSIKAGCGYHHEGDESKGFELTGYISPEDSARIVACVNACAGIDDPVQHMESMRVMRIDYASLTAKADFLEAQRDELLTALKEARGYIQGMPGRNRSTFLNEIDTAIANAEKGVGE